MQEKQRRNDGPLHMDVPVFADQQEFIYISNVWTQDVV